MKQILVLLLAVWVLFSNAGISAELASTVTKPTAETNAGEATPAKAAPRTTTLTARFATLEEGQELMRGRELFHEQINEESLAFLLQKKEGTLEEYIEYAADQVLPFTPEEEQRVKDTLLWLQQSLEKHHLRLLDPGTITFVKSTGEEVSGASGYTSGGTVFLSRTVFDIPSEEYLREIAVHEIFHCLSRLFPEFRQAMYSLIHFTVMDHEIDIPEDIQAGIIANPDVEHHNSYAAFTINGQPENCYLICLTDTVFEEEGDSFFQDMYTGIVPLGGNTVYQIEDVPDFWDIVGRNTDYTSDPEEIMAENFCYAMMNLDNGFDGFMTPVIPRGIVEYLSWQDPE